MPGYFAANIAELRTLGIPRDQIHVISPSSRRTNEANAAEVRARFLEIAREGPERLVVIAHSRGASDALAFALENPKFVKDHIRALFLVQGAFGGSGLAGYVTGSGEPMDRRMKLRHRIVAGLVGRLARVFAGAEKREIMEGMSPEASSAFWAKALDKDVATLAEVGSKVFYVRSSLPPARQRAIRRAMAWYLLAYHGPNDGVVALEDQSLPGFGTVIANLEAGACGPDLQRPFEPEARGNTGWRWPGASSWRSARLARRPTPRRSRSKDQTRAADASMVARTPSQSVSRASRAVNAANLASRQRTWSAPQTASSILDAIGPCSSPSSSTWRSR